MNVINNLFVLQFIFSRKFIFKCVQYIAFISATDDDNYMQNTLKFCTFLVQTELRNKIMIKFQYRKV